MLQAYVCKEFKNSTLLPAFTMPAKATKTIKGNERAPNRYMYGRLPNYPSPLTASR